MAKAYLRFALVLLRENPELALTYAYCNEESELVLGTVGGTD